MNKKLKIKFLPDNKIVEAERGCDILSLAFSAGIYINSSCGGDGVCGNCKVIVRKGVVNSPPSGKITEQEKEKGYVLACMSLIDSDCEIEIPPQSRINLQHSDVFSSSEIISSMQSSPQQQLFKFSPLVTKFFLELPKPNIEDFSSDLSRIERVLNERFNITNLQTRLPNIRRLGDLLRESNWQVTVSVGNSRYFNEIILIEPQNTSERNLGIVFDIGTTTITGQLIDLKRKKILGTKLTSNRQAAFGADVITRIIYSQKKDGLEKLHKLVIDALNMIIDSFVAEHKVEVNDLTCCVCAGNTTMIHLLLEIDPKYIRREPYIPTANKFPVIPASEIGININPGGLLYCVPNVASYVGGDITCGVLASGLDRAEKLSLLIDIGTNGEMVLGNKEWMISAAASAGPAFEGSGVGCGMKAVSGAIQKVKISKNFKVDIETIGNKKPTGICGSGYIDIIAELLKMKILDKNGKFIENTECNRIRDSEFGKEFVIAFSKESGVHRDITINEADIDNLKRAKAAIYSAAATLLRRLDLKFEDIQQIFIGGGFGTYLDIDKSIAIGLLPDLPRERFRFIGNSSLAGAREIILSSEALDRADFIAQQMTYHELSTDAQYMQEYIAALFFPHTELGNFPSVEI